MSITRPIPLLLPLLFAIACGSAQKPPSGPDAEAKPPDSSPGDTNVGTDSTKKEDPSKEITDEKNKATPPESPAPAEAGPAPGKASVEKPLSGGLSDDDIRAIMMKNGALFDDCYKLGGADKSKQLVGTVKVQATIGPSGNVNEVKVLKSTVKVPKVDTCVADAFRKIKFPPPSTGATSVITFPINFEGVEMVKK